MKKIILPLLTALCMVGFQTVQAQVDLTVNPIGLLFGDFSVGADLAVNENMSVELAVGFGSSKIREIKGTNFPVNVVGKYYFSPKNGADRFYGDVFIRYVNRSWNYDDNSGFADYTSNRLGLGFGLGYKIVSNGGFVFDIGFGLGRAFLNKNVYKDSNGTKESVDWPDLMTQGKLAIGYRFGGSSKK